MKKRIGLSLAVLAAGAAFVVPTSSASAAPAAGTMCLFADNLLNANNPSAGSDCKSADVFGVPNLVNDNFNDVASSAANHTGHSWCLYTDANYAGQQVANLFSADGGTQFSIVAQLQPNDAVSSGKVC